eukprot:scaffold50386_cov65-Phaeocystis_antarctica.AAC.8
MSSACRASPRPSASGTRLNSRRPPLPPSPPDPRFASQSAMAWCARPSAIELCTCAKHCAALPMTSAKISTAPALHLWPRAR